MDEEEREGKEWEVMVLPLSASASRSAGG